MGAGHVERRRSCVRMGPSLNFALVALDPCCRSGYGTLIAARDAASHTLVTATTQTAKYQTKTTKSAAKSCLYTDMTTAHCDTENLVMLRDREAVNKLYKRNTDEWETVLATIRGEHGDILWHTWIWEILIARPLRMRISEMAKLVGYSRATVKSIYGRWLKDSENTFRRRGFGRAHPVKFTADHNTAAGPNVLEHTSAHFWRSVHAWCLPDGMPSSSRMTKP